MDNLKQNDNRPQLRPVVGRDQEAGPAADRGEAQDD